MAIIKSVDVPTHRGMVSPEYLINLFNYIKCGENEVAIAVTSGIAKPSTCGQAIISTVTARTRDWSGWPIRGQVTAVITAATTAR